MKRRNVFTQSASNYLHDDTANDDNNVVLTTSQPVPPGDRVVDQPLEPRPVQVPGGEVGQRGGRVLDAAVVEVGRGRGHTGGRDAGHAVERPLLVADGGRGPGGRRPRQYLLDAVRVARRAAVLHLGHGVQRGQRRAAAARHVQKVEHGRQHVVMVMVVLLLGQHHCGAQRRPVHDDEIYYTHNIRVYIHADVRDVRNPHRPPVIL